MQNIVILSGGFSEEAEVSKVTSKEIASALNEKGKKITIIDPADFDSYIIMLDQIKKIKPDLVFIGLHGAEGENGSIQSLLKLEKIPFTGSGERSSAIAMDKYISGILAQYLGIKLPKRRLLYKNYEYDFESFFENLSLPLVVKPNDSGSSVGISIIKEKNELSSALDKAFIYSKQVLLEEFIDGRELTVTILGNKALPVVEIIPHNGWYDYDNKYTKGNTIYEVPAKLSDELTELIQKQACDVFELFGCEVYARVDFRLEGEVLYFLEVNTLPGMTKLSLTPMAAEEAGFSFKELIYKIIELSIKR
ncbi:MAG: D-alanine--D-alanine ligase [Candidatus Cloacimonetes bacterium]|nr:D-alanine--D-alanine ligase [Candidatus Cloacimonadota bacterium]